MARSGALRSRVAVFVFIALCTSLVTPVLTAPSQPEHQDARLRIAVGECADSTDDLAPGLSDALEASLAKSLANEDGVRLVSQDKGQPDRILSARVATLTMDGKRPSEVQIVAEVRDALTNEVTYRTVATGVGAARPGETAVARAERAVGAAAGRIASQVVQAESIRCHVVGSPKPGVVVVDCGATSGMVVGTELEIIQDGRRIAGVRIHNVKESTSVGRLYDVETGARIDAGDGARVISIPAAPVKTKSKKKRGSKTATIIGAVLAAGLLIALLSGGGGGGGGGGARMTAIPADTSLPADGFSSTSITVTLADRKGNPFPDGTPVRFQTDLGLIGPAQAAFSAGVATATLTAGVTPGTATVTTIAKGNQATCEVEFTQGAAQAQVGSITIMPANAELPADGLSTTTITVVVGDINNNAVPDGTDVQFGTDLGLISPPIATTTNGVAQAELRSSPTEGTATITVTVGDQTQTATVEFIAPVAGTASATLSSD